MLTPSVVLECVHVLLAQESLDIHKLLQKYALPRPWMPFVGQEYYYEEQGAYDVETLPDGRTVCNIPI